MHLVLAHGFTQTARSWDRIVGLLDRRVAATATAVDLPGHGEANRLRRDLWGAADHLVATGLGDHHERGVFVGYSMGGRVALHAALAQPSRVERLVLIGATAGIDEADERAARREADQRLADSIVRRSLSAFLDDWLAQPLFAGLDDDAAMRDDRLRNTRAGLASSLRLCGTGTQAPLWSRLGEITCPTLVLVGERDAKFTALGERLVGGLADARLEVIGEAGHSVHLERPEATADAIAAWLGA